jgi:ComF family protein
MTRGGDPVKRSNTRPGKRWFERVLEAGLDFLFPPHCSGCGKHGCVWCSTCDQELEIVGRCGCPGCGFPRLSIHSCDACMLGNTKAYSYARYQTPLKQAILHLKYAPDRQLADQMAAWLLQVYKSVQLASDLIVPVPIGDVRRRERGYNQVELIASALARDLKLPFQPQSLLRVHETRSQVGLDPEERFENVQDAFSADTRFIHNRKILLVDDLLTSGATLLGCARALFEAGAVHVDCLTVGRTIVS